MNQQQEQKPAGTFKALLLSKVWQYLDGILINTLFALLAGGAFWIVQHLWGLRLIPFNVLDALLLSLVLVVVILLLVALVLYLLFRHFLSTYPAVALGLLFGLLVAGLATSYFSKDKNLASFQESARHAANFASQSPSPPTQPPPETST